MTEIIEIDSGNWRALGNLYNYPGNQIRRRIGRYTTIAIADRCGTVRDRDGIYWDWWIDENATELTIIRAT